MSDDKDDFMDLLSLSDDKMDKKDTNDDELMLRATDLTEEEIQKITIAEVFRMVSMTSQVIGEVKDMVIMGAEAEFGDVYAKLIKSQTDAVKILADFGLQKEKLKVQKELKQMDIAGKKEIADHKFELDSKDPNKQQIGNTTNNIIISSREEVFARLFEEAEEQLNPTIDIEVEESTE